MKKWLIVSLLLAVLAGAALWFCYLYSPAIDLSGWVEENGSIFYQDSQGNRLTGWQEIDGTRCYFGPDGILATGWVTIGNSAFYFHADGTAHTGWLRDSGFDFYLTEQGAAVSPTVINGITHYFTPSGIHVWLVNPWNSIPEDYTVELFTREDGYRIAETCAESLEQMLSDCRAAGNSPVLRSAYRTYDQQRMLYEAKYAKLGEAAGRVVAVPNTSEHQLGLAVDIADGSYSRLDTRQEDTPAQQWLMEHCWEYGFILRYPKDSTDITGIIYEPWHYRYVGTAIALELRDLGITLEEYLGAAKNPLEIPGTIAP